MLEVVRRSEARSKGASTTSGQKKWNMVALHTLGEFHDGPKRPQLLSSAKLEQRGCGGVYVHSSNPFNAQSL